MNPKKLKFGWTYASLDDFRHGVPKQFCVLDESGACKRPATPEERCLIEWLKASSEGPAQLEVEWTDADAEAEGEAAKELQERIDSDMPLSVVTINEPEE